MKGSLMDFLLGWRPNENGVEHQNVKETKKEMVDDGDLLASGWKCCC
jgi:hypothetical protein